MRDIAIDEACMPGKGPFEFVPHYEQAAEWYLKQIQKDKEENPEKYESDEMDSFDDHSDFGNSGDDVDREIASEQLKEAIAKAIKECEEVNEKTGRAKGWGSVSNEIRKEIKEASGVSFKLDPKKVLASFIKASINADKKSSVTKRNRRLPGKKFGRRSLRRANIAISIDQSGSVSDELLMKVFDWLGEFAKFVSFTVVPFDHQVFEEKIYVWQKGEKRKRERVLYGGTDFNAPTQWVNERKFDGHIIVTDMLAPKPVRSNCQRMWITDKWGSQSTYFQPTGERVLVLD
jgi:predicted metal-dependent peptidase